MLISYTPYITGKLSDQCRELQLLKKKGRGGWWWSRQNRRKERTSIEQLDSTAHQFCLQIKDDLQAKRLRLEKSPNLVKNLISFIPIPYRNFCARTDGSDAVSRWRWWCRLQFAAGEWWWSATSGVAWAEHLPCLRSSTSSSTHSPRG